MTLFTARTRRRLRDSVGVVAGRDERAVSRAATRGPVLADPALREAALRLARFRAEENRRRRIFNLSVFPVFTVGSLLLATSHGLLWLAAAVLFGGLAVWTVFVPRRLADRISVLSDPHGTDGAVALSPSGAPTS